MNNETGGNETWEVYPSITALRVETTDDGVEEVVIRRRLLKVSVMTMGTYRDSVLNRLYPAPENAVAVVIVCRDCGQGMRQQDIEGTPTFLTNAIQIVDLNVAARVKPEKV